MEAVDLVGKGINIDGKFVGRTRGEIAFQRGNDVVGTRLVYLGAHIYMVFVEEQAHLGLQACPRRVEGEILVKIAYYLRVSPDIFIQCPIQSQRLVCFLNADAEGFLRLRFDCKHCT